MTRWTMPRYPARFGQVGRFARLVLAQFGDDRLNRVAQALSYMTLLAVVPLTTLAFGLFSVFPVFEDWMDTVQDFLYTHFVPASGDVVQKYLTQFASKSAQLTAIGLLFLIFTALFLMETVEETFNDIWRAPQKRKPLHRFLSYWAILTLGPILLGLSLSLTSYLVSLPFFKQATLFGKAGALFLEALPMLAELLAFTLLYVVVPNIYVKVRHALVASFVAMVLFEVAKYGFAFFVINYSAYQVIYGAIAALPVFLIWIYVSWAIILLGAVIAAALPKWGSVATPREPATSETA